MTLSRASAGHKLQTATIPIARTLYDWLREPGILDPPLTAIPHLALEGRVSLLSGREKIGKSTLICGAIAAASNGQPVLGVPVVGSVVALHYNNDEPIADTIRRYQTLGADADSIYIENAPRSIDEVLAKLKVDVEAIDPDVVVLDNLSRALAASGVDPNSSHHVEPAIARLVDFFHDRNLAAVLLYHTGKSGREYRGSTSIGATVDEVLTLRRRGQPDEDDFDEDGSDDGRRLLTQDGRNLRGRLHLCCINGTYGLYDDSRPPREKILQVLERHGSVTGKSELVRLAGVRKAYGLEAIAGLQRDGMVKESRRVFTLVDSVGSREFPEGGTMMGTRTGTGSHSGSPPSLKTGTASEPACLTPEEEAEFFSSHDWT
jgi:hypothetical protein